MLRLNNSSDGIKLKEAPNIAFSNALCMRTTDVCHGMGNMLSRVMNTIIHCNNASDSIPEK